MSVPTNNLTELQGEVMLFIGVGVLRDKRPPTLRELMSAFDWASTNTPRGHLRKLQAKGYLEVSKPGPNRVRRTFRSIKITQAGVLKFEELRGDNE